MLASVDHPKMLSIHEVGSHQNRPYLVMDLVEGVALEAVLEAGPLPPEAVIRLALDIIGPLAAAHQTGLVHRDLKPENIMVEPDGTARLIDFGLLARQATNRSGAVVGTLSYAAPEQSGTLKRPVDNRSDLYSLGVVLFRCLAGVLPFVAAEVGDLLRMHAVARPPDLEELVPDLPPGLAATVAKLLAKDPEDRYQSGAELVVALKQLQGNHNAVVSDTTPGMAGRNREHPERTDTGTACPAAKLAIHPRGNRTIVRDPRGWRYGKEPARRRVGDAGVSSGLPCAPGKMQCRRSAPVGAVADRD
jgi:serine/threonine protein kinase